MPGLAKPLSVCLAVAVALVGWQQLRPAPPADPLPDVAGRAGACTVWFVGSSSMFRWTTLGRDMMPWDAHNRGVSGATIAEITPRLLRGAGPGPRALVFYGGENDIDRAIPVTRVVADLHALVDAKTRLFGATPLVLLSLKRAPARWDEGAAQQAFNQAAAALARSRPDLLYADLRPALMRGDRPGPFFVADGIHLNADGYRVMARVVQAALASRLPPDNRALCRADARLAAAPGADDDAGERNAR